MNVDGSGHLRENVLKVKVLGLEVGNDLARKYGDVYGLDGTRLNAYRAETVSIHFYSIFKFKFHPIARYDLNK